MVAEYVLLAIGNVLRRCAVRLDSTSDAIVVRRYVDGMRSRKGF